jgi:dihydrofolate synthase/folylpolyglutamate synthase
MASSYQDALDYIYSFIDPARKGAGSNAEAARNVARMHALLAAAGSPQDAMPSVVVAGTKGKGSTAAMVEAMARTAGLRTGLFTSPHLSSYRERIQLDREPVSQAELVALVDDARPVLEAFDPAPNGPPTTFDVGVVLALRHFAARGVQLAVMEIGLGGRFDSVNALTPLVSAISSISYDHTAILGPTLAAIAWNKAGIVKPGVPAVTVPQAAEAMPALEAEARALGTELWVARPEGLARAVPGGAGEPAAYPVAPRPALRGDFQRENARLALGVALLLRGRGVAIPDAALAGGLASVSWPARFELLPLSPPVLIDGAHNGDSARRLVEAVRDELAPRRVLLVLGTSRDKDIAAMAAALAPHAAAVVLTRSRHHRAMDIDRMAAEVGRHLRGPLLVAPDVAAAIDQARRLALPGDLICVTGSLFVAAEAREALGLAVAD